MMHTRCTVLSRTQIERNLRSILYFFFAFPLGTAQNAIWTSTRLPTWTAVGLTPTYSYALIMSVRMRLPVARKNQDILFRSASLIIENLVVPCVAGVRWHTVTEKMKRIERVAYGKLLVLNLVVREVAIRELQGERAMNGRGGPGLHGTTWKMTGENVLNL